MHCVAGRSVGERRVFAHLYLVKAQAVLGHQAWGWGPDLVSQLSSLDRMMPEGNRVSSVTQVTLRTHSQRTLHVWSRLLTEARVSIDC